MLQVGSFGDGVKKAQRFLNQKTILPPGEKALVTDGKFGPMTEKRVKLYQIQNKLSVTGKIDSATGARLGLSPDDLKIVIKPIEVKPISFEESENSSGVKQFIQENKRNITIVAAGLGAVLVLSLILKGQRKAVNIKSNPRKKKGY